MLYLFHFCITMLLSNCCHFFLSPSKHHCYATHRQEPYESLRRLRAVQRAKAAVELQSFSRGRRARKAPGSPIFCYGKKRNNGEVRAEKWLKNGSDLILFDVFEGLWMFMSSFVIYPIVDKNKYRIQHGELSRCWSLFSYNFRVYSIHFNPIDIRNQFEKSQTSEAQTSLPRSTFFSRRTTPCVGAFFASKHELVGCWRGTNCGVGWEPRRTAWEPCNMFIFPKKKLQQLVIVCHYVLFFRIFQVHERWKKVRRNRLFRALILPKMLIKLDNWTATWKLANHPTMEAKKYIQCFGSWFRFVKIAIGWKLWRKLLPPASKRLHGVSF